MKIFIVTLFLLTSATAMALPKAPFNALEKNLNTKDANGYDFESIVKLSNCSGSVIHFAGQPLESKALVLTNGHCLNGGFLKPGEVVRNKRVKRKMKVSDTNMSFHYVTATKILYATMTGTDAAIYQLKETYQDLLDLSIKSLLLSSNRPFLNTNLEIISGYWERGYSCFIDAFIYELREAGWIWTDSILYSDSGCETIGGTSGSPIIDTNSREVIGVNNTGNDSGAECTLNNPCEVDVDGNITIRKDRSYGQQTYIFYSCLTMDFKIDTNIEGCLLAK